MRTLTEGASGEACTRRNWAVLVVPPPPQPVKKKVPHENSPSQSQAERLKIPPRIYSGLPETPDYMKLDSVVPQDPIESSLLVEPRPMKVKRGMKGKVASSFPFLVICRASSI